VNAFWRGAAAIPKAGKKNHLLDFRIIIFCAARPRVARSSAQRSRSVFFPAKRPADSRRDRFSRIIVE